MSPTPTGRLLGHDLVLTRTFRAPIDDVWASVTEPERTARWFGGWEGDGRPGGAIKVQLIQEEGKPWMDMTVDACEAPHRLAISSPGEHGWRMELALSEAAGVTELRFTHFLTDTAAVGDYGPGWEFYLDALVAAREDAPAPVFGDYYPAQQGYYQAQVDRGSQ